MSAAASPPPGAGDLSGRSSLGRFEFSVGVSIGILLLITTITLASYYCKRHGLSPSPFSQTNQRPPPGGATDPFVVEVGLDDATIKSYSKILYSEAKANAEAGSGDSTTSCCSICLGDYRETDQLRQMPGCNHLFHVKCVDRWLRLHPTCPVCRTSPLSTPSSSPLVEVVPFAAALRN